MPKTCRIQSLRKNSLIVLAPGFRPDLFEPDKESLKMGYENVKLFLRKPLLAALSVVQGFSPAFP
jgi:hypothetical protein